MWLTLRAHGPHSRRSISTAATLKVRVATRLLLISVAVPVPGARRPRRREALRMPEVQTIRSRLGHYRPKPQGQDVGTVERGTQMPTLRLRRVEADALQAILTSGVPHSIRNLAAGSGIVAMRDRIQEVQEVKMEQLVTEKGLEIVGPAAPTIGVDAMTTCIGDRLFIIGDIVFYFNFLKDECDAAKRCCARPSRAR